MSVDSVQSKHLWIAILEDAYIAKKNLQRKLKHHEKTEEKSRENKADEFKKHFLWIPTNCSNFVCGHLWIATLDDEFITIKTLKMETEISWKNLRKTEEKSRENAEMNFTTTMSLLRI